MTPRDRRRVQRAHELSLLAALLFGIAAVIGLALAPAWVQILTGAWLVLVVAMLVAFRRRLWGMEPRGGEAECQERMAMPDLPPRRSNSEPDVILKRLRNIEIGQVTEEYGELLAREEHRPGWFNATWDFTGGDGLRPSTYSHPGHLLLRVDVER